MPSHFIYRLYRGIYTKFLVYIMRGICEIILRFYGRLDEDWLAKAAMTH